jgi:hypothetical protein
MYSQAIEVDAPQGIKFYTPRVFEPLDHAYRYKVMWGGRGSGKSWAVARKTGHLEQTKALKRSVTIVTDIWTTTMFITMNRITIGPVMAVMLMFSQSLTLMLMSDDKRKGI